MLRDAASSPEMIESNKTIIELENYENLDETKEKVRAFIENFSLLAIASISGWDYIRSALANIAVFWRSGIKVC
jgi:hypothetical protein